MQGVTCVMLTGDNARTGRGVGRAVGVSQVFAEMLPADKVEKVQRVCAWFNRVYSHVCERRMQGS